ncbi:MAG: PQQ-dependent sugar dehydrogenase [Pyrinomonadaceae bacterium]
MDKTNRLKLLIVLLFAASGICLLFTDNAANRTARAFSAGPPAGYTHAPGEEPEACAECHVNNNPGTGRLTLDAPRNYVPGQTYQITVNHANADQTRIRWGFELTALDDSNQKAGTLENLDNLTQVLNGQGPFPTRQYIEHTANGTFFGQHNGASWTFKWTAPPDDAGPVTFYVAGNQANGDGNTSGDNIYFTFATATSTAPTPDYAVTLTPSTRTVTPGNSVAYDVTVTPSAGFTGSVSLAASGLPAGSSASFNPPTISITDASAKTSTLTVTTGAGTPTGSFPLNINATSGALQHTATATLVVASPSSADLTISNTDSPDPVAVGTSLSYRINVTNNGPATATNVNIADTLPAGVNFNSATPSQGSCAGTTAINCAVGSIAVGASATVTIVVQPQSAGPLSNTATVSASEADPIPADNSATATTVVEQPGTGPRMTVTNLSVRTVVAGLDQPTSMAFIGANDFLVLEKASGKVRRVTNGGLQNTVLDLAVNNASERGLLGIALHPNFASNHFVYLYWTESSTGVDTGAIDEVPLLGNRVDRYIWNNSTLTFDRTLIRLRAFQADAGQPSRGNHNGGVLRFGPDGKLYVVIGDNGRRGLLQNITSGGPVPDDQFGGPEPDDAHLTGVILRLNDDGTTPTDNPFFNVSSGLSGEAATNVKKIFAYGVRNSFGMDFDPISGNLWTQENGDDAFDEINRVTGGANNGWIQVMGPSSRVAEFKAIETSRPGGLQQNRWSPALIADTPAQALSRLYMLPGAHYAEPELSWRYSVAPSPVGFAKGTTLGAQYADTLFVGASRTTLLGGFLFRLKLSADRQHVASDDPRLADGVADNLDKFDLGESESLVVGRDFGITTDIQTGPNGNLYVVSLSNGAVYEIFGQRTLFVANLNGAQEVPPTNSHAIGTATILLDKDETTARVSLNFAGLSAAETASHIHGPALPGATAAVAFDLPSTGNFNDFQINVTPQQVRDLKAGLLYINVHSSAFPAGEIRGQFGGQPAAALSVVGFSAAERSVAEGAGEIQIAVNRLGDASVPVTVDYATSDGTASERADYTAARGTLRFAAGEMSKTFSVLITDDVFVENNETINLTLSNLTGASTLGNQSSAVLTITDNDTLPPASNPIDDAQFFVRQHYHDFLNREPDAAGLAFWTNQITECGTNAGCREARRINVSAAFFISIEFQQTGFLVYRAYEAAYGNIAGKPVPLRLSEFLPDTQGIGLGVVVGAPGWEAQLETNKRAYFNSFVALPRFTNAYPSTLTAAQFVDALNANTGNSLTQTERNALVSALTNNTQTRAEVLRSVVENGAFAQREFNRAFVLMQYFGYLRRNPDDAPEPGLNFNGYNFWLGKLNEFGGNFVNAEMVKAFITSGEYRGRFGP